MPKIIITSLKIGEYEVPVPPGLSELLETTWVAEPREPMYIHEYDHKVIKKDGCIVTLLTKKIKT